MVLSQTTNLGKITHLTLSYKGHTNVFIFIIIAVILIILFFLWMVLDCHVDHFVTANSQSAR